MTRPVDLTEAVAELTKRVTALEARLEKEDLEDDDPNLLARLPREERRKRLGLSILHEGEPDHRDEPKREDPIEIIKTDPVLKEPVPLKDSS